MVLRDLLHQAAGDTERYARQQRHCHPRQRCLHKADIAEGLGLRAKYQRKYPA